MVLEFLVALREGSWAVLHRESELGRYAREQDALREADRLARQAYRMGEDARVLACAADGRVYVERSYGRHPLVAPGLEYACVQA
jgi:hypothetical protein